MKLTKIIGLVLLGQFVGCAKSPEKIGKTVPMKLSVSFPDPDAKELPPMSLVAAKASEVLGSTVDSAATAKSGKPLQNLEPEKLLEGAEKRFSYKKAFRWFNFKISNAAGVLKAGSLQIDDRTKSEIDAIEFEARSGDNIQFDLSFMQVDFMSQKDSDSFCSGSAPGFVRTWTTSQAYAVTDGGEIAVALTESGRSTVHMAALKVGTDVISDFDTFKARASLRDTITGFVLEEGICPVEWLLPKEHQNEAYYLRAMAFALPLKAIQIVFLGQELKISTATAPPRNTSALGGFPDPETLKDLRITAAFQVEAGDKANWRLSRDSLENILPRTLYPRLPLWPGVENGGSNTRPLVKFDNALFQRSGATLESALVELIEGGDARCESGNVLHSIVTTSQSNILKPILSTGTGKYQFRLRSISPNGIVSCSTFPDTYELPPAELTKENAENISISQPKGSALQGVIAAIAVGGAFEIDTGPPTPPETHLCAVQGGALKCWGSNSKGQLGNKTTTEISLPFIAFGLEAGVTAVSAGQNHTCAAVNNELKCWGSNSVGQLGTSGAGSTNVSQPTSLSHALYEISSISAGENNTCAVSAGKLFCWGSNSEGQLGASAGTSVVVPTLVPGLNAAVSAVATRKSHTCAIAEGALWCFGSNSHGQLGVAGPAPIPPESSMINPSPVPGLDIGTTSVSVGNQHTCAIKNSQLFCWGSNLNGQLGLAKTQAKAESPQLVPGMEKGVTAVAAGDDHTCAIKESALYCWGRSDRGQVGNGTAGTVSTDIDKPILIFASGVTAVSAGAGTCAVLYGRELKCWGSRFSGVPTNGATTAPTGTTVEY